MSYDVWDSVKTVVIRELVDRIKEKFGDDAYLELYTDGSGLIRYRQRYIEPDKLLAEFDGLGELSKILQPSIKSQQNPSGLNRAGWGGLL